MAGSIGAITSDVKRLLEVVGGVSPLIGSVLGSPFSGIAISLLCRAFGVDGDDVTALVNKISSDPRGKDRILDCEASQRGLLEKIASDDFSKSVEDKEDARKYGEKYRLFLMVMASFITFGFFGCLSLIFWLGININDSEKQLLMLLIGMLASKWQTIIDFFYGSSNPH